jgi:predicted nucleic acid-binding protein
MPLIRARPLRERGGMWADLHGRHMYLDANVLITALEGFSPQAAALKQLLAHIEAGDVLASTSDWTLAEILVRPLMRGDKAGAAAYNRQLSGAGVIAMVPASRAILCDAARICAQTGMPLPDCLHVATAVAAGCDVFASNDRGIELPAQMERLVPDSWA